MWAALKSISGIIGLVRTILTWLIAKENQQIGRNEVANDVTRKTAETENAMRDVGRPDDESVSRSMQDRSF